jgi:hypothetical protein
MYIDIYQYSSSGNVFLEFEMIHDRGTEVREEDEEGSVSEGLGGEVME